jgi:autotransporter-associated beta strand protein
LTFKTINLMPHSTTPAQIAMTGDVNIVPLANGTATIANGSGSGASGFVDLMGGTRAFNVSNGAAGVDLAVNVPIQNGGLTKTGTGTMLLGAANTYVGATTVSAGMLTISGASARLGRGNVTVQGTSAGTALTIQSGVTDAINDGATLSLFGGGAAGVADQGYASLGAGINESVGALILNGVAQATGLTFGSTGSSAVVQSDEYFAGAGVVSVGLPGDFNGNGSVDASDFVTWRMSPTSFGSDSGYNLWRANFGNTAPGGGASLGSSAVPEPGVLASLIGAIWASVLWSLFGRARS